MEGIKDQVKIDMGSAVITMIGHAHSVLTYEQFRGIWIKCFDEAIDKGFSDVEYVRDKFNMWRGQPLQFFVGLDLTRTRGMIWGIVQWYETYDGRDDAKEVRILYDHLSEMAAKSIV